MSDPSVVASLAISTPDLVAAAAANARTRQQIVLRVTPPYSGRMRARIHVVQPGDTADETLHVSPEAVLREDAPPCPTPDETADELRAADGDSYSVERHRDYHERRVEEWRETLPQYVVDTVFLPAVGHDVTISLLGTCSDPE